MAIEQTPGERWVYHHWEDMPPTSEELKSLKKMLADAMKGNLWTRIVALMTFAAVALLVWIYRSKAEVRMMIKDQQYEQDRARDNQDRVDNDDLIGRPRE